jgi:hypothetical protein
MKSMLTDPPVGATPERLAWLHDQLASRMTERPIAGEIFRPRGAWGDRPMRFRRFALRHLGVGSRLHELERDMGLLNLAVATQTRLHLFRMRGSWGAISVADEIAVWPLHELHIDHERRTVESKRLAAGAGTTATTMRYDSRIVVLRIQPPRGTALEIDVAHSPDCSALLRALVRVRGAG